MKKKKKDENESRPRMVRFECKKSTFFVSLLSILFGFIAIGVSFYQSFINSDLDTQQVFNVPPEVVLLLKKYDRNDDGYLDIIEFEPIGHKILSINTTYEYNTPIDPQDEVVTINAYFEPIQLDTMTKNLTNEFISNPDSLKFLKQWKYPYTENRNFGCQHFKKLIPTDVDSRPLGQVWYLIPRLSEAENQQLSSNRYFPLEPSENEIVIYRLLQMFHKRPFLYTRFPPQGTAITLRARNKNYVDIMFRVHAEFQLNEPPYYPFWFTPGQFVGRLIIAKDSSHIEYFHMYVPNDKRLNVDMEWLNGPIEEGNAEVDIGYMPRMELVSSMSSVKATSEHLIKETGKKVNISVTTQLMKPISHDLYKTLLKQIKWEEEIDIQDALDSLEKSFFPFKEVKYYPFLDAFKQAQTNGRLVHCMLLWGALDDQSC